MQEPTDGKTGSARSNDRALTGLSRLAIEFGPLLLFFSAYKLDGLMTATAIFMAGTGLAALVSWFLVRRVAAMVWVNLVIVSVMGGLTLWLDDDRFVKMKPTLLFSLFAAILFIGRLRGVLFLRTLLGASLPKEPLRAWRRLTDAMAGLFVSLALINEVVWRSFSTDIWVSFKVFGVLPLMLVATAGLLFWSFGSALGAASTSDREDG